MLNQSKKNTHIKIIIETYNIYLLNTISKKIHQVFYKYDIYTKNAISLPTTVRRFTVLKSPHVNKKARNQFELRKYKKVFIVYIDNFRIFQFHWKNISLLIKIFSLGAKVKYIYSNF